jgi:hypothetical protein
LPPGEKVSASDWLGFMDFVVTALAAFYFLKSHGMKKARGFSAPRQADQQSSRQSILIITND